MNYVMMWIEYFISYMFVLAIFTNEPNADALFVKNIKAERHLQLFNRTNYYPPN
jgi:hypothetical protein